MNISAVAKLILVRRIFQQFRGLRRCRGIFFRFAFKVEVLKHFLVVELQAVVKSEARVGFLLRGQDVSHFLGQHRGEAGFIGQNVNQSAAEHDGMPHRKRFDGGSHQNAALNFGLRCRDCS